MKRKISYLTIPLLLFMAVTLSNPLYGQSVTYPTASGIGWRMGVNYTINWSGFSTGYDVRIDLYKGSSHNYTITSGTANDGSFTWTVPTSLAVASDYRIRVTQYVLGILVASDYSDNYFTIANPKVIYPSVSGISWRNGSSYNITWSGYTGSYVRIDLYKGSSLYTTITSSTANDGSYSYTVPGTAAIGNDYRIRINSTTISTIYDYSNSYFTISNPQVTYPSSSGINWRPGNSYTITWSGFASPYVKIELYKGGSLDRSIVSSTANDGSYTYTVPATLPIALDYYVRITSTAVTTEYDISNFYFAVGSPQVTYPSASGIIWRPGYSYTITWSGFPGSYVKIELYKAGALNSTIISSTDNDGSHSYTVPSTLPVASDYYIRITSTSNSGCYDLSNYYFVIANPQVVYPSASGITWNVGSTYNITWSGFPGSYVRIDLYKGSTLFDVITASTANDGTHPWTVPTEPAASDYYVKITSTSNTSIYDNSNYYFAIVASLNVTPASISLTSGAGANGTFNITSNTSWSITDDAAWLSVSPASGTNNATVTVTATSANTGSGPRTATVTIAGAGVTPNKTVTVTQAASVPTNTLGNTTVYGSSSTTANRRAIIVTCAESGTIQSISIYHNGGTGRVLLGVYADISGSPGGRLGVTPATTINASAGWQTVTLSSSVTVTAGQKVWLSWVFENNPGIRYITGTPARAESTATWPGGMPNPFGAATFADYKYSVYCTYVPGAGPVTKNLGNTTVYSSSSTTANRRAQTVTFTESGTIQSITMYHNGGTGNVIFGVYADAGGAPGARLGVTSATVINAAAGWQTVSLMSPVAVASGQKVWLSWVFENNPGIRYISGTPARAESPNVWSGGMPDPFGTASFANYKYSLYCTYATGTAPVNKTLGNTEVYSSTSTTANRRAQTVTFTEAGTIQSISMYHNGGTGSVIFGVYADAGGAPGTRLGVTSATVINAAAGWQTVSIISPVSVASGQKVWLSWVFENNPGIRYIAGTPARAESPNVWSGGMPDPFGTASFANYKYSLYCTYTTGTGPVTNTLGNTDVYGSSSTTANRRAITVTFPEPGTIQSISVYHNGGTGNVLLGVYADAGGAPGARMGVTASTAINSTAGWQTIPLTSAYSATSGQKVWLAWVFENNPGIRYITGTPARAESPQLWAGDMPDPFGTASFANYKYSIYCTYSSVGGDEIKDIDETKSVNMPTDINPVLMDKEDVLIYPNPTEGEITITWKNRYSHRLDITIYNILGKAVREIQTDPDVNEIRLDLDGTSRGIYLFEMKDKKNDLILNRSRIIKR